MALIDPIMVAVVALATLSAVLCLSGIFFPWVRMRMNPSKCRWSWQDRTITIILFL